MNEVQASGKRRSRLTLVLLLLVFVMPVVIAYLFYMNPQWQPKSTRNYGVLFEPAVALQDFTLQTGQGESFTLEQMRGKWSLIYIGSDVCDEACMDTLFKARQARLAQGIEAERINYYYLLTTDSVTADKKRMLEAHPKLVLLHGDEAARRALISQFAISSTHQPGDDNRLYLVDPLGNVFMHYPAGFRDLWLMEDLKHVLKWSQIG